MMRVVLLTTVMEAGGAQKAMLQLAAGLQRCGHRVLVVTLYDKTGICPSYRERFGVEIVDLDARPSSGGAPQRAAALIAGLIRLVSLLRHERPHVLQSFTHYANIIGPLVGRLVGVPLRVASQRNRLVDRLTWVRFADRLLMAGGFTHHMIAVSRQIARFCVSIEHLPRRAVSTVANGIAVDTAAVDAQLRELARTDLLAELGIADASRLILTVARLHPQKGHADLLAALPQLRARHPDVHLVWAGDGALASQLAAAVRRAGFDDVVHFLGQREDIPALLAAADVFVLPSYYEGMPNAVLEAQAAGLPVVATAVDGTAEVVIHTLTGLLVPPRAPLCLAHAINRILDRPHLRRHLGDAARLSVVHDYSLDAFVRGFQDCWSRIARRQRDSSRDRMRPTRRPQVLETPLDPRDISQLHAEIHRVLRNQRSLTILSQNLHGIAMYHSHPDVRELHRHALVSVDGMPVLLWARLMGYRVRHAQRVTWVDWLPRLCATAQRRGWRVFYLGSTADVLAAGLERLRAQYPDLAIDGHHGHFPLDSPEAATIAERITAARPDILLVGMGMPRQERWVLAWRDRLSVPAVLTCGAAMDYVSGAQAPPPRILGAIGLEWLHRLAADPRRLARRYLIEPWSLLPYALRDLGARIAGRQPHRRPRGERR